MISSARTTWSNWWNGLRRTENSRRKGSIRRASSNQPLSAAVAAQVLEERVLLSSITVTNGTDASGAHAGVTLRDAINQANQLSGADTIVFDSSLNGTSIKLTQGQLNITDAVTIRGNGAQ